MKICWRGLNSVQVKNADGDVRICGWIDDGKNGLIGNLQKNSFYEIFHSREANEIRERLYNGDYSKCAVDHCPYCANDSVESIRVEVPETPEWPESLSISFENVCNYRCTSCNVHQIMESNKNRDLEPVYDKIEEELRIALPHIKTISSNGLGELFCSKRALKLLSEWKPLAPKEECKVALETNGSLFNRENWEKISNLGEYYVDLCLTVMSFDEDIYQMLSGTKLPISVIESNLDFVRELREKNVINRLTLCTVYQEANFRTIPDLIRRFLDYKADLIRVRPYAPWGEDRADIMWFKDIRNQYHPYHKEFLKVWSDPIFKNEKVWDGGGGHSSSLGESPYVTEHLKTEKELKKQGIVERVLSCDDLVSRVEALRKGREVAVYGIGVVGKAIGYRLNKELTGGMSFFIDNRTCERTCLDRRIYKNCELSNKDKEALIIISLAADVEEVKRDLEEIGFKNVVAIEELV